MKKIILNVFLFIFVILTANVFELKALAAEDYGLFVGGVTVNEDNAGDIFGDESASYDYSQNVLYLNNCNISKNYKSENLLCGIGYTGNSDLTISLYGDNKIGFDAGNLLAFGMCITNNVDYKFTGDGTLTIDITGTNSIGIGFLQNTNRHIKLDTSSKKLSIYVHGDGVAFKNVVDVLSLEGEDINSTFSVMCKDEIFKNSDSSNGYRSVHPYDIKEKEFKDYKDYLICKRVSDIKVDDNNVVEWKPVDGASKYRVYLDILSYKTGAVTKYCYDTSKGMEGGKTYRYWLGNKKEWSDEYGWYKNVVAGYYRPYGLFDYSYCTFKEPKADINNDIINQYGEISFFINNYMDNCPSELSVQLILRIEAYDENDKLIAGKSQDVELKNIELYKINVIQEDKEAGQVILKYVENGGYIPFIWYSMGYQIYLVKNTKYRAIITMIPSSGYGCKKLMINSEVISEKASPASIQKEFDITGEEDIEISAEFYNRYEKDKTIYISNDGYGEAKIVSGADFEKKLPTTGQDVYLSTWLNEIKIEFIPKDGYEFDKVSFINNETMVHSIDNPLYIDGYYTFTMPEQTVELKANFKKKLYSVTIDNGVSNDIKKAGKGDKVSIVANTLRNKYKFLKWTVVEGGDDSIIEDITSWKTNMLIPGNDVKVKAIFEIREHECKEYLEKQNGQASTCTEPGYSEHYKCTYADECKYYEDADALIAIDDIEEWKKGKGKINPKGHTESKYFYDNEGHWTVCLKEECGEIIKTKEAHVDDDENYICDICEMKLPISEYMVNVKVNDSSMGSAKADYEKAEKGKIITLYAAASEGYRFEKWQSDQIEITDNKFIMPAENVTVTAIFIKNEETPTLAPDPTSTPTPTPTPTPDPILPKVPEISVKGKIDLLEIAATKTDKKPLAYAVTNGNKKSVKITKKGILTAKKAGKIEISAYADKKKREEIAKFEIIIKDTKVPKKLTISYLDEKNNLKNMITDLPYDNDIKFYISEKQNKFAVIDSENGVITPVKDGKVKVIVQIGNGKFFTNFYTKVTIKTPKYSPSKAIKIKKGRTKSILLKNVKSDAEIKWSVSDEKKAKITESNKKSKINVEGIETGKVILSADIDGHKYTKEIEITE